MQPRMGLLGAAYHGGTMMHKGRQQGPMSALLSFFASPSLKNDPRTITFQTFTLPANKVTRFPGLRSVTVFSQRGERGKGLFVLPSITPLTRDLLKFQGRGKRGRMLFTETRDSSTFSKFAARFSSSNPRFSREKFVKGSFFHINGFNFDD